jgi:hypothetical protein
MDGTMEQTRLRYKLGVALYGGQRTSTTSDKLSSIMGEAGE